MLQADPRAAGARSHWWPGPRSHLTCSDTKKKKTTIIRNEVETSLNLTDFYTFSQSHWVCFNKAKANQRSKSSRRTERTERGSGVTVNWLSWNYFGCRQRSRQFICHATGLFVTSAFIQSTCFQETLCTLALFKKTKLTKYHFQENTQVRGSWRKAIKRTLAIQTCPEDSYWLQGSGLQSINQLLFVQH